MLAGLSLLLVTADAQERLLELRGQLILPEAMAQGKRTALVTLFGATRPFAAQTRADYRGRFKFTKIRPGPYNVSVFLPGHGETRQTIDLGPSSADARGRVRLELRVEARQVVREGAVPGALVSVRRLSIPEKARDEYRRAFDRLQRNDVRGAIAHLEKAVALSPQFSEALNTLGTIAFQSGDYARAESYFQKALEQSPDAFEPLVNLGGTLLAQRRPFDALPFNRKSVDARPGDALANSQMGLNLYMLGKTDQAIIFLQEAKRLDPGHFSNPQLVLAEIYLRRSQDALAASELEDFLHHHPDVPEATKIRAQITKLRSSRP